LVYALDRDTCPLIKAIYKKKADSVSAVFTHTQMVLIYNLCKQYGNFEQCTILNQESMLAYRTYITGKTSVPRVSVLVQAYPNGGYGT
jgi:hypothetical protein